VLLPQKFDERRLGDELAVRLLAQDKVKDALLLGFLLVGGDGSDLA
jgi:hypothetical protein